MKELSVKKCTTCKWVESQEGRYNKRTNVCVNPIVILHEARVLAGIDQGMPCFDERNKYFLGSCGVKGKLWEAKEE